MGALLRSCSTRCQNVLARSALAASLLCSSANPSGAQDRDVLVRFLPPEQSEVTGYSVYATDVASELEELFEVGFVAPDSDGVARTTIVLDAARSYRVSMTAYNDAGESARSNEIHVAAETPSCDPALCDDGDPCTADTCDAEGCLSAPLPEGTLCDDGYLDTVDDQCVQGVCEGIPAASEPPLVVEGIDPAVVSPGRQTLMVYGQGFVLGSSLSFINGAGPAPRVMSLRLVDARTLEARVDVSPKGPRRSRVFDALVTSPDGSQALLPGALRIDR